MKIGIMGAMDEEIQSYLVELRTKHQTKISELIYYQGTLSGKSVVVVKSGAGKVNASICTQQLISEFNVDKIIFTGVAGAINPLLNILDIVISKDCIQHDMDAGQLGFKKGQIPFSEMISFVALPELIELASAAAKTLGLKAIKGRILTGDQFITDKAKARTLIEEFKGDCVDMESAAVAQVCFMNAIPYLAIRSISDKADHSASIDFNDFLKQASKNSFLLVKEIISELSEK